MRVLGIDPGLRTSGYAVLAMNGREPALLDAGVIRIDSHGSMEQRLSQLADDFHELLTEHRPTWMTIEELYAHYKHPRTSILMGHARGVMLAEAGRLGIAVQGFSATRIKKSLTGSGRATKEQVQQAITRQLGLKTVPKPADVADAMAIGLCGLSELTRPGHSE